MDDFDAVHRLDSFNLDVGVVDDADEHDVHHVGSSDFMEVAAAVADGPLPSLAPPADSLGGETAAPPSETETDASGHGQAVQAASSSYKPYPIGTRLLMSQSGDSSWLTPYLCLLRSQLEVFSATPEEIAAKLSTGGNKVPPIPGQVGIRCVHCKTLEHKQRAKSSESFPSCIKNVHQAVRNYQRHHYPKCQALPAEIRAKVESIKSAKKAQKSRGSAGNYWMASCVRDLHMSDGKDGRAGIFFAGTENAGEVPDVSHILGGESTGGLPLGMSSDATAGADVAVAKATTSNGGSKKKKTKPKSPKIKKAIKSMFRKDAGAPDSTADGFAAMNVSAHSIASGTASSMVAGTLNCSDIPQQTPQQLLSNDSFRRNSSGGGNVPIPQMPQQVHASAAMQMYSPNWELFNNHGGSTSALTPLPSSSLSMPMNLPNPAAMIGTNPTVAPASSIGDGFQVGTTVGSGAQGGRRSSFPGGGSEFPIEMFEPRPLREDGKGFVDEAVDNPAASAYFAAGGQNPAQVQSSTTAADGGNAGGGALANTHFQTEYGFMGINDVVKGHEEAEKRKGSHRDRLDRRSSWTSRDSHGSSTFLSSGSKRGLSDGDGDSVGTNEYEPPRRRPSIQSSLGGDLDDFRALDLDNDDDFNNDFGMMEGMGGGNLAEQQPSQEPQHQDLGHVPAGNAASHELVTAAAAAAAAAGTTTHASDKPITTTAANNNAASASAAVVLGRGARSDSNVSDSTLLRALEMLDEAITAEDPTAAAAAAAATMVATTTTTTAGGGGGASSASQQRW